MNTTKTLHFYLRTDERRPVGVVALCMHGDAELRVAMSLCHPNDQWDADRGIAAAQARLTSDRPGRALVLSLKGPPPLLAEQADGRIAKFSVGGKHPPVLLNLALELKPHGTKAKDQGVGINWTLAQEIFERHIDHLLRPAAAAEASEQA